MDHLQFNYSGKTWKPCPTEGKGDCFFHSVFGTRSADNQLYRDKYAKFRRLYWSAFLTYHSFGDLTGALLKLLKRCFIANDKHIENPREYADYTNNVTSSGYWVLVEEILILATLENVKIILFIDDRVEPEIFEPEAQLLVNFPFRNVNQVREVAICLVDGHYARLNTYEKPITTNKATSLLSKSIAISEQDTNKKTSKEISKLNRKNHYKKLGEAGIKGSLYQINLLTMVLLNGVRKVDKWRLSTEDKEAAKLDDLIFEYLPSESTVLLQAKHKQDEKKEISYKDLMSVNKNSEFSLPKYFFSYQEVKNKFKVQNVGICTNLKLDEKTKGILKAESVKPDSVLHFEGAENICYGFKGCSLPKLKQTIRTYYVKNLKKKKIIISDEDINDFLEYLKIFCLDDKNVDKIIVQIISQMTLTKNLSSEMIQRDIHKKMTDWFQEKKGRYLTELEGKAFFCDIRSNKFCDDLKLYDISFKTSKFPHIVQTHESKHLKRISHIIIPDKEYILNVVKTYQALLTHHTGKALFVNPDDSVEVQKEIIDAFEVQIYTILVMVCPNMIEDTIARKMCDRVVEILNGYKYKQVILIAEERNNIATKLKTSNINDYESMTDNVTFADLEESTQEKFKSKKLINFQGTTMSLEELFIPPTKHDLNQIVNSKILAKLAREIKTEVGLEPQHLDNYYICRSFNRNGQNILEEDLWHSTEKSGEKVILISDSAGMGKSSVLTSLAISIKKENPYLWVIRFNLNSCTNIIKATLKEGGKYLSLIKMLESQEKLKLRSEFDKKLFATPNRVVLMLDGVDEVSPTYTELVINLIRDSLEQANLTKIFVTTRPHMSKDLEKISELQSFKFKSVSEDNQEKIPTLKSFALEPFSKCNQIHFLTKYWIEILDFQDDMKKNKCYIYAQALIENISTWTNERDRSNFAGIPLQTRMLAEIFQEDNQIRDYQHFWEGCREFSNSDNVLPKLPKRINLTQLYELFIDKKRDIFISEKSNPSGRTAADEALKKLFDKCQEFHRMLALKVIFEPDKWNLFTCYTTIEWPISSTLANNNLLRIGIVQMQGENMNFIHRTFAEYFIAECLVIELERKPVNKIFQKFFMNSIMREREYFVIRAFLDSFMRRDLHLLDNHFCSYFHRNRMSKTSITNYFEVLAREGCVRILNSSIKCIDKERRDVLSKIVNDIDLIRNVLLPAINFNHLNALKLLLDLNVTFNKGTNAYREFLYEAVTSASGNNLEIVKFLVDTFGVNVNGKNVSGNTALHVAAYEGKLEIVKFLVKNAGADVEIKNKDGDMALHRAALWGRLTVVKYLVEEASADINKKNYDGDTALHRATFMDRLEVVKYLVEEAGADINIKNNKGETALPLAVPRGTLKVVKFLVEIAGLDINIKDNYGETALHLATRWGRLEAVKFLVKETGADIYIKNNKGLTAFHLAAQTGKLEIVKFMVTEADVDINIKNNDGSTALHLAVRWGVLEVVEFLVKVGRADIRIKDDYCGTALHTAVISRSLKITKFLVEELQVNVNVKNNDGSTALHLAARSGNFDIVKFLVINAQADININDNEGRTALRNATDQGHWKIVKFLSGSNDLVMFNIKTIQFFRRKLK